MTLFCLFRLLLYIYSSGWPWTLGFPCGVPSLASNIQFSFLNLPKARITGLHHHAHQRHAFLEGLIWLFSFLSLIKSSSCLLNGPHSRDAETQGYDSFRVFVHGLGQMNTAEGMATQCSKCTHKPSLWRYLCPPVVYNNKIDLLASWLMDPQASFLKKTLSIALIKWYSKKANGQMRWKLVGSRAFCQRG